MEHDRGDGGRVRGWTLLLVVFSAASSGCREHGPFGRDRPDGRAEHVDGAGRPGPGAGLSAVLAGETLDLDRAGLYEEMLFRLVGMRSSTSCCGIFWVREVASSVLAVVGSAVIFAPYHDLSNPGEQRTTSCWVPDAGGCFPAVHVLRGFGIVVGTHALRHRCARAVDTRRPRARLSHHAEPPARPWAVPGLVRETAEPSRSRRVVSHRRVQVRAPKSGHSTSGDVDLGVRDLPEQEVADPALAGGADEQVRLGYAGGVQAGLERLLVDGVGVQFSPDRTRAIVLAASTISAREP